MEFEKKNNELIKQLEDIKYSSAGIIDRSIKSIIICRNLLSEFKKIIVAHEFESIQDEVDFFKRIKQVPFSQLIYYSEVRSFEIQFPKVDRAEQLKFIKKKINKLNRFFLYNLDFGQYVNSGASHFDKAYYTRDHLDTYHITTSKFYFQDPDFCTPRDMLLGKFKAYLSLVGYMDQKQHYVKNSLNSKNMNIQPTEKIPWPFTNTDWVELLYALCANGLAKQNGQSITKISKILQEVFDFTPKEIYKTFQDIKNRKNSRTLFLDQLTASLLSEMNKSEE
ncbi:MAG: RteC domain-containing protein [Algibacter sp.]|uniref:RteC domain-containing protein n=1 Tax=Algibacter sp. TaxID=1872428 RepID=UPI0026232862|nr:RteC domain-containing protein [Algibacter sp.]MDG1729281.1 RteC domain-containing protein [Algibacter sp.]MDG2179000.1 RteC domain-containing protein [Algibacter sp.]